ncbi:unnamed protein product [Lactuca saligna]|uniref:Peptidase M3A/M3B catalytic domain-containing protein n=1 Tax=Lactuca saligna TaxID=75948 RepID=A0AA35V1V2_LACSI|nr:unnamed protein product [Lactuca saligna]
MTSSLDSKGRRCTPRISPEDVDDISTEDVVVVMAIVVSLVRSFHRPLCSFSSSTPKHLLKYHICPFWSPSFLFCLPHPPLSTLLPLLLTFAFPVTAHRRDSFCPATLPSSMLTVSNDNPLLKDFMFPPFDAIDACHDSDLVELEKTVESSWQKLVEPLEKMLDRLSVVWGAVNHLKSVKDTPELRSAIEEIQPEKFEFDLKLGQSKPIYNAFKAIRESPDWAGLSDAQKRIVECKYLQVLLIVKEQWLFYCAYQLSLQGHENATAKNGPWVFTLDAPSFMSIIQHAKNRALRKEVYDVYITRSSVGKLDNTPVIEQILKLRLEKAKLLGYNNYAEVSMATKMATVSKSEELLEKLRSVSWNAAVQDMEDLKQFAKSKGAPEADNLNHWDNNI